MRKLAKIKKFDISIIKCGNDKQKQIIYGLLLPYYEAGYNHLIVNAVHGDKIVYVEGVYEQTLSENEYKKVYPKGITIREAIFLGKSTKFRMNLRIDGKDTWRAAKNVLYYFALMKPINNQE